MQTYQQRVLEEYEELTARTDRLREFVMFGITRYADDIPEAEARRLWMQLNAMELYQAILQQRIENFSVDPAA